MTSLEQSSCSDGLCKPAAFFSANQIGSGDAVTDVGDGAADGVGDDIGVDVGELCLAKPCFFTPQLSPGSAGGRVLPRTTTSPLALGRLVARGAAASWALDRIVTRDWWLRMCTMEREWLKQPLREAAGGC